MYTIARPCDPCRGIDRVQRTKVNLLSTMNNVLSTMNNVLSTMNNVRISGLYFVEVLCTL